MTGSSDTSADRIRLSAVSSVSSLPTLIRPPHPRAARLDRADPRTADARAVPDRASTDRCKPWTDNGYRCRKRRRRPAWARSVRGRMQGLRRAGFRWTIRRRRPPTNTGCAPCRSSPYHRWYRRDARSRSRRWMGRSPLLSPPLSTNRRDRGYPCARDRRESNPSGRRARTPRAGDPAEY